METINSIELRDESIIPDDTVLAGILGDSFPAYKALIKMFDDNQLTHQWRYYKDGKAWLNKVQKKDKTIVWMSAWKGCAHATIYFPEKYIDQIYTLNISEERKQIIRDTKNTGKSKPCTFEVKTTGILDDFNTLMQFKIKSK
ncbi:MAG: DUF3788 family protein [Chloroflexi bacterium]|jgi:hypothetical protein|nr:DUF3788 family protein [Chloroflexota bacterium]